MNVWRNPRRRQGVPGEDRPRYTPAYVALGIEPAVSDPSEDFRRAKEVGRPAASKPTPKTVAPEQSGRVFVGASSWFDGQETANTEIYADEIPDPPKNKYAVEISPERRKQQSAITPVPAPRTYVLMVNKTPVFSSDDIVSIKAAIENIVSEGRASIDDIILYKRLRVDFGVTIEE